jgi:hypothetical protein
MPCLPIRRAGKRQVTARIRILELPRRTKREMVTYISCLTE